MWRNWDTAIGLPSSEKVHEHYFNWIWSILLATYVLYMQYFVFKDVFLEGQDYVWFSTYENLTAF